MKRIQKEAIFKDLEKIEYDAKTQRNLLEHIGNVLRTHLFETNQIRNPKALWLVFNLLRNRVGSPVSYKSLSEDVGVSPTTIKKYIQILEALFVVFRVTPYSKNIARSLLKEPKIYFFDTGLVEGDDGAKFENLMAVSLLKHTCALTDYKAQEYKLHYLRTKDGVEVDFALALQGKIEQIIEAKLSDDSPSKGLVSFQKKYQYPAVQVVKNLRREYVQQDIKILSAQTFLSELFL